MKKKPFGMAVCMFAAFVLWTFAVRRVDVQPIGPMGSAVGFAALNQFVHRLTGVHMFLYIATDWLSLIPIGFAMSFAFLGLKQWIERKHFMKVDRSLPVLGGFYIAVIAFYLFFETEAVNHRPVLINGILEASYPSSTTLLTLCIMPTTVMQLKIRLHNQTIQKRLPAVLNAFTVFMVIGRLISGVHWFSDIVGGVLLSTALVMLYRSFCGDDLHGHEG